MHLMNETPDIIEKITSQQKAEDTIKNKNKEDKISKAGKKKVPEGTKKMDELYKTTDKENKREEKQKKGKQLKEKGK